jgi:hypothetical protein
VRRRTLFESFVRCIALSGHRRRCAAGISGADSSRPPAFVPIEDLTLMAAGGARPVAMALTRTPGRRNTPPGPDRPRLHWIVVHLEGCPMEIKKLNGGNLRGVGYDDRRRVLVVELTSGTFEYGGVSAETYRRMLAASSPWSFFRDNIDEEYAAKRIR